MERKIIKYCITSATVLDEYLWFCSVWFNFLFKFNMKTYEIEDAIRLPVGYDGKPTPIVYIYNWNHEIYMIPNDASNKLIKYSLSSNTMDLLTVSLGNNIFGNFSDEDEEYVYLPIVEKKQITCLHKKSLDTEIYQVDCKGKGIQGIKKNNLGFMLLETGIGDVVITDKDYREKERLYEKPRDFKIAYNNYYPGIGAVCLENEVVIFPRYSNMIYSVNLSTKKARQYGGIIDDYSNSGEGPKYSFVTQINKYIWLYSNHENDWIIFDEKMKEIERVHMRLAPKVEQMLSGINLIEGNRNDLFVESKQLYTLENYVRSICM